MIKPTNVVMPIQAWVDIVERKIVFNHETVGCAPQEGQHTPVVPRLEIKGGMQGNVSPSMKIATNARVAEFSNSTVNRKQYHFLVLVEPSSRRN